MEHFVAYHKVAEWGKYKVNKKKFTHSSRHHISVLNKAIGQALWVISGERVDGQMIYKLCAVFSPSHLKSYKDQWHDVSGKGIGFNPPIPLNGLAWFRELISEQQRFRFGINQIKSSRVVQELENLRGKTGQDFRLPDEVPQVRKLLEGTKKQITVNAYERNTSARSSCIAHYGSSCSVCGFNFEKRYGEIGKDYIHVHHLMPLAAIQAKYEVDPIADLRPVCPNCHAMIHCKEPPYTIEELRSLLKTNVTL